MTKDKNLAEHSKNLSKLAQLINENKIDLDDIADMVPGVLHVNSRKDFRIHYMSQKGCKLLGYSLEELQSLGPKLFKKHQCDYTLKVTYPKLIKHLAKNDSMQVITFFQDWYHKKSEHPVFHFTSTKILNDTQAISISLFPENKNNLSSSVNDLFGINTIFKNYFTVFATLTKREKQVLQLLGKEFTRKEIALKLNIANRTAKKHCENIFRKLGTTKRTEIAKIAMAFSTFQ
jgi:DNA-binding CsgD family transcriptional regulator